LKNSSFILHRRDDLYLLRFDDLCPTMNWAVWERIERLLVEGQVRPLVAVVPDNKDRQLQVDAASPTFWESVRRWQSLGWAIGMHGYQHLYVTREAGLLGMNSRSEFAGLSEKEQEAKIHMALAILQRERVRPRVWIAPSHSFDETTLCVLIREGIRIVSDGMFLFPFRDERGMIWIPQQMWRFRRLPLGVWTICFHHNRWNAQTLERFERDLHEYRDRIVDLDEVIRAYDGRRKAGWEMAASHLMTWAWRLRRRSVRRRLSGSGAYNDRAKADE